MKEFNIKCNNKTEAKFIEKYLLEMGCIFDFDDLLEFNECEFKKSVVLFNLPSDLLKICFMDDINDFNCTDYQITEAKYLMRKEKLKRINNERS